MKPVKRISFLGIMSIIVFFINPFHFVLQTESLISTCQAQEEYYSPFDDFNYDPSGEGLESEPGWSDDFDSLNQKGVRASDDKMGSSDQEMGSLNSAKPGASPKSYPTAKADVSFKIVKKTNKQEMHNPGSDQGPKKITEKHKNL